ncbi:hypothetical protein [Phenylobacterium sp.]|uniref:DUF6950 family protein n=1 Tax=Phenylobacterium sp. TaxID=1871053 RepID=UPI002733CC45|nr:hypothetical protein [Phenylobacterium sp.]MDP3853147.1 hypothetical protein [Phenylobacterium sp.]
MRDHDAMIALVESRARAPLAWGDQANDCVSFARAVVTALIGRDPLAGLGHHWTSQRGAQRVLRRLGGLEAAVDSVLPRIAPSMAKRGDVGLVTIGGIDSLVVVEGDTVVGPGDHGLVRLPRRVITAAWSVA